MASRAEILANPALGSYLAELAAAAGEARSREIPSLPFSAYRLFEETGDRSRYEAPYFERRRALVALALSAWLWEGRVDDLEDLVWAVCDEYGWALPAHEGPLDLFACETAFALAEILSLLEGRLAPKVVDRARAEVERRVLVPFLARAEPWPFELMRNNWCAVCAGSIGAAALYLIGEPGRLDAVLSRALPTLDRFLESFTEDGACLEGLGYWTYGLGFYVSFAELLERRSGGAADLLSRDRLPGIAAFQSKAYLNGSLALSFADGAPGERYRIGLADFLSRRYPEASRPERSLAAGFGHDRCGRWCLSYRDLLWAEAAPPPARAPRPAGASREGAWLSEAQWLICPAAGEAGLAFAAKGGHNGEPHNHNDVGSFELVLGDEMLMADLGPGEYTRDYFNERRYSIFCTSSLSHSLPIIEGRGQEAGAERRARDVEFRREGGRCLLRMDLAAAYLCPELLRLRRSFDFDGSSLLIIVDEFEFSKPGAAVTERFVTGLLPSAIAKAEGGALRLGSGGRTLSLSSSLPSGQSDLVAREHRAHDGSAIHVTCLDYALPRCAASFSVSFEFRLSPE